ncbi:MAG: endo alpha-1,4 polygalactosaminidase [Candidatus Omnitrophica bacterium]|nr:endo alpha-1,4 polygalactosaminidase [Candidatus Omnitrophota bacterium]
MKKITYVLALGALLFAFFVCYLPPHVRHKALNRVEKWFILLNYKPDKLQLGSPELKKFDMAVVDPDYHLAFPLLSKNIITIGYVSVGEAENYRAYWEKIKKKGWVIKENPDWKGDYYVDITSDEWQNLIVNEVVKGIVDEGFKGIMMDTVDMVDALREMDPVKYKNAEARMVDLVKKIRRRYPGLIIISNNGFSVLERIAPYLDGMIAEDINMMPDFKAGGYKDVPAEDKAYKVGILNKIKNKYGLSVFNIDYAPKNDKQAAEKCRIASKKLGYKVYVAEKDLDEIYIN